MKTADTNSEELRSDEALMAKIEYLLDTGYATDVFDFIKARDQQLALAAQVDERKLVDKELEHTASLFSHHTDLSPIAHARGKNHERIATLKAAQEKS